MGNEDESSDSAEGRVRKDESSYHHGDLRNALIRAGIEILKEHGSEELSLRRAARAAGVSQAAPYRHFANKEALLSAIAHEGFTLLAEQLRRVAQETHHQPPDEILYQASAGYLAMALEHPHHYQLMIRTCRSEPTGLAQELFKELVTLVTRCQKERVLRAGNSEQLALVLWSGLHGLTSLLINRSVDFMNLPATQSPLLMRALVRNLLEGLAP